MNCPACHDRMIEVTKDLPWETPQGWVMLHAVRHWECPVCGEQVFDRNATKEILEKLNRKDVSHTIEIPVLK